jgi:hypothetical protein
MSVAYTKEYLEDERAVDAERASQYVDDVVCELREAAAIHPSFVYPVSLSQDACGKVNELCRMLVDLVPVTLPSYSRDYEIDSRGVLDVCLQSYRETVAAEVGVDVDASCAEVLGMCDVMPENAPALESYVKRIGDALATGDAETRADVSVEVVRDVCHWIDERVERDYFNENVFGLSGTAAYGLSFLQDEMLRVADDYERLRYEAAFGSPFEKSGTVRVTVDDDFEQQVNVPELQ